MYALFEDPDVLDFTVTLSRMNTVLKLLYRSTMTSHNVRVHRKTVFVNAFYT